MRWCCHRRATDICCTSFHNVHGSLTIYNTKMTPGASTTRGLDHLQHDEEPSDLLCYRCRDQQTTFTCSDCHNMYCRGCSASCWDCRKWLCIDCRANHDCQAPRRPRPWELPRPRRSTITSTSAQTTANDPTQTTANDPRRVVFVSRTGNVYYKFKGCSGVTIPVAVV